MYRMNKVASTFENNSGEFRNNLLPSLAALNPPSPPIILVGNKIDLLDICEVDRGLAESLAKQWHCPVVETSALTGKNVHEAFLKLVQQTISKIEYSDI
ncbi:unnamed protein product [Protopolystoma xenopodis]|uniref:Uncharacterized protein n=1 Tax=Protopolystoma xenopodis TaxID=117903 RepID=A0A3S5CU75_9PLAT|nr:unnamed protein product [Protopolystoma xenopodis]